MKVFLSSLFLLCLCYVVNGQSTKNLVSGSVSFVSTQNVYVKFENTEGINVGDTLYIERDKALIPALKVTNKSSISCVCSATGANSLPVSTPMIAKISDSKRKRDLFDNDEKSRTSIAVNDEAIKAAMDREKVDSLKQHINGRVSLSAYSENSTDYFSSQKFRYNLSLNATHINNSKFSAETNITFTNSFIPKHTVKGQFQIVKDVNGNDSISYPDSVVQARTASQNFYIYTLAVKYDLSKTETLTFGRKLNVDLANIGAVDGLQYTKTLKNIAYGAVVGSRPNYFDYGIDPRLMQIGAFVSHKLEKESGSMQTSFALFNQTNNFKTDRRFAYLQHHNSLLKKVDLFCSFEADLYTINNSSQSASTFDLTSTYVSLNYQPWRRLSLSLSYDARKNVYYYETFKNRIDSIYDRETRQGLRFQFNYRPLKYIYWGGTAGYRMKQKSDSVAAINAYTYLNYSNVPLIDASLSINATLLKTNTLNGTVYGASLSRDLFSDKLYAQIEYRMVDYQFLRSASTLHQDIIDFNLSYMFSKKLFLSVDYELTKEDSGNKMNSLFINLTRRF